MEMVNFLAELLGFSLVVIGLLFLVRPKSVHTVFQLVESAALLFLVGLINIILGIALILAYNVWDSSWRLIISLFGWLVFLRGVIILFFPEFLHKVIAFVKTKMDFAPYVFVAVVVLGCALVYLGMSA